MTKIYVMCHKRDKFIHKIPYSYYIPVLCGSAIYEDPPDAEGLLPQIGDNTGDNISAKNPHYCELTGMYWAWKNSNLGPNDIIGINHYRRYFESPITYTDGCEGLMMSEEIMIDILKNTDFIISGSGSEYTDECEDLNYSVYEAYKGCHYSRDMDKAIEAAKLYFPEYAGVIEHDLKKTPHMNLCNMFITKKKYFDDYCNILFKILFYVESKIDFKSGQYEGYQGRVMGFLAERLQRPILMSLGYSCKQAPTLNWEKYSGYVWE